MATNGRWSYSTQTSSDQFWLYIYHINIPYLLAIISLFGVIANVINICIFIRQGFGDKINLSLLALSISDVGALLSALAFSACNNPSLQNSGLPVAFFEVQIVIGGVSHSTFSRIMNCITTYITFERCMCVVFPMKVKTIITARVTVVTMVTFFLTLSLTMILPWAWVSEVWRFDVLTNRTIMSMTFEPHQASINTILTFQMCVQLISFILVAIFTIVLAVELRRQSQWRRGLAQGNESSNSAKVAERKVGKTISMVTAMAVIYIACYSVSVGHHIYNAMGPYYSFYLYDIYWIVMSFTFLLETINSSMGIFLCYAMSTKYRTTFLQMFAPCRYTKSIEGVKPPGKDLHVAGCEMVVAPTRRR